jgi:putative glutamine amidotransferase
MRIGLTYTGSDAKHENYARWLRNGEDVEVVKLAAGGDAEGFDGLVLSGGVDIHPSYYGGQLSYDEAPAAGWNKERDAFEIAMLERAWAQGIPVLGVCRGLQLINVCCGGTLVQDLGKGDEQHQNTPAADKEHAVRVDEGSLLYAIAGPGGWINSAHHQAIDRPGEGLKVNCHAGDGVIEGIEWAAPADRGFMLAVQWHPERMYVHGFRDQELYLNIRNRFIEEIKKSIKRS